MRVHFLNFYASIKIQTYLQNLHKFLSLSYRPVFVCMSALNTAYGNNCCKYNKTDMLQTYPWPMCSSHTVHAGAQFHVHTSVGRQYARAMH